MRSLAHLLTDAERDMMVALRELLEGSEAVTISPNRVAIIVRAKLFDQFNALVELATTCGDREPDADAEPCDCREIDADFEPGDEMAA